MFGSADFWDKSFYSGNFKFSKIYSGNLSQTALPNNVITSANRKDINTITNTITKGFYKLLFGEHCI